MEIETRKDNETIIISLNGKRMDAITAPKLEEKLNNFITDESANCFIINFNNLEYISSAGLRVIISIEKKLRPTNGKMLISNLRGTVKDVFEISGFLSIFKIFDTEEEALKNIAD